MIDQAIFLTKAQNQNLFLVKPKTKQKTFEFSPICLEYCKDFNSTHGLLEEKVNGILRSVPEVMNVYINMKIIFFMLCISIFWSALKSENLKIACSTTQHGINWQLNPPLFNFPYHTLGGVWGLIFWGPDYMHIL